MSVLAIKRNEPPAPWGEYGGARNREGRGAIPRSGLGPSDASWAFLEPLERCLRAGTKAPHWCRSWPRRSRASSSGGTLMRPPPREGVIHKNLC